MKNTIMFALAALMFIGTSACAQSKKERKSPMNTTNAKIGSADVSVQYSSPSVKEREIWGDLVPYGKVWRTGANEATIFETSADIKVEGKMLPAGKYSLFTIPGEKEWTVIFNKEWEQWGAYKYKEAEDALRVQVKPNAIEHEEMLVIRVKENKMVIAWEKLAVEVKLQN